MAVFMIRRRKKNPYIVSVRDAFAWWGFLKTERKRKFRPRRSITPFYVVVMISAARRFYAWLMDEEKILLSPFEKIEIPKPSKALPRDILTHAEMRRLLFSPDTRKVTGIRDRAILELLYSTGFRRSEVLRLTLGDVDFSERRIFAKEAKGKKDRVVPIGKTAVMWIRKYLSRARPSLETRPTERIWLNDDGEPMKGYKLGKLLLGYASKAKLSRRITPHTLRHTFATHMIDAGASVAVVQRILGHTSIRTTQIYTRVTIRSLRAVHRRTHPRAITKVP